MKTLELNICIVWGGLFFWYITLHASNTIHISFTNYESSLCKLAEFDNFEMEEKQGN